MRRMSLISFSLLKARRSWTIDFRGLRDRDARIDERDFSVVGDEDVDEEEDLRELRKRVNKEVEGLVEVGVKVMSV